MKKYLSIKSVCGGLAVMALMTSCVAKKKYTEAQNQITTLQTENAQLKETGTSMQQNIATLESSRRGLQTSLDSTNTWVSGQQSKWNSFQAFYDEGTKTTEQVHQMLHTQLDDLIGSENITTSGGRIYVTLAEKTLFSSGSSKLSAKGTEVLTSVAQAIKDNPNVEIDIAATPGYYTAGSMTPGSSMSMDNQNAATTNQSTTTNNNDLTVKQDDDLKMKDDNTKIKVDRDGDVKVKTSANKSTVNRSASSTVKKSTAAKSTARKSESKSRTYASSPARKSASASSTWSLNMARSGAIAKKLVDEGVAKSRILVNSDQTGAASTTKDFQVIISPKADTYYNSIGNGSTNNK